MSVPAPLIISDFGERGRLDRRRRRPADGIIPPRPAHLLGYSALRIHHSAFCILHSTGRPPIKTKNRAKRSGDDLEARGIFEFSTTVVLGVFRQWSVQNLHRNQLGNKEQFHTRPKFKPKLDPN